MKIQLQSAQGEEVKKKKKEKKELHYSSSSRIQLPWDQQLIWPETWKIMTKFPFLAELIL